MRDDDFFKDTPKKILDAKGQKIEFPVLYYDFRFVNCIFTIKLEQLKRVLPHPQFKPIQIWPGTGMISICAFEYRDTSIGPYNEVSIAVPINFPPASFLGKHSAFSSMRKMVFPVYIHQLPVTTDIAKEGGVYFFNYPKFLAEIDFRERDDFYEVTLKEDNELILKLLAKKLPLKRSESFEFHTFSLRERKIMHTLVEVFAPKFGKKTLGKWGELELGSHRISEELKSLKLNGSSRIGFCGDGTMAKLHDPDIKWDGDTSEIVS